MPQSESTPTITRGVPVKVTLPRDLYDLLEQYRKDQDRPSISNVIVHALHQWREGPEFVSWSNRRARTRAAANSA